MSGSPQSVLVNPPLWNAYAPHLAVPLLVGTLRARGLRATGYDLSIESVDHLLSADTLADLAGIAQRRRAESLADEWARQRALLVAPHAIAYIDETKQTLRTLDALHAPLRHRAARGVLRDALRVVSGAFPGTDFDLVSNTLRYSHESTAGVLAATTDPIGNPYRWAFDRMLDWSRFDEPDLGLVGVSISADTQLVAAMTFLRMLRERRPDVHCVVGGNFATRMVERWMLPHPFFDLVDTFLVGEGEDSLPALATVLPALADCVAGPDPRESVPGAVWSDGVALHRTTPHAADVRRSAVPAFEDLPLNKYLAPGPVLPVFASRSCAWNCAFCSIPFASGSFRQRPAAAVVAEVQELVRRHGGRYFMFVDEIMTLRTLDTVSAELVRTGTQVHWYGETRFAGGLTPELARQLYASGCRRMNFGLESTSQRVLDLMRKGTSIEHIVDNVRAMLGAGVPIHLFVIHGFPGETRQEADDTVSFAEDAVRESRETYGVPWSTWGGSPFILDVHSPVGAAPERFGITVLTPAAERDLALSRGYHTDRGMSASESRRLAAEASGRSDGADTVWFRAAADPTAREVEEFTFLRACNGAPQPAPTAAVELDTTSLDPDDEVDWSGEVVARRVPWAATEHHRGTSLALYHPSRGRFIQMAWPLGVPLDTLHGRWVDAVAMLTRHGCSHANATPAETARLLLRHGFLVARTARPRCRPTRWHPEVGIAAAWRAGRLVLTNPITDVSVRLTPKSAAIWTRVVAPGAPDVIGAAAGPPFGYGPEAAVLTPLADLGFLVGAPPRDATPTDVARATGPDPTVRSRHDQSDAAPGYLGIHHSGYAEANKTRRSADPRLPVTW